MDKYIDIPVSSIMSHEDSKYVHILEEVVDSLREDRKELLVGLTQLNKEIDRSIKIYNAFINKHNSKE